MSNKSHKKMRQAVRKHLHVGYQDFLKQVSRYKLRKRIAVAWQIIITNKPEKVKAGKVVQNGKPKG